MSSGWRNDRSRLQKTVWTLTLALLIFLIFRLIFKAIGASEDSVFVMLVYALTEPFVWPFVGIGRRGDSSLLDTPALAALLIYPILIWLGLRLAQAFSARPSRNKRRRRPDLQAPQTGYGYPTPKPPSTEDNTQDTRS